MEGHAIECRINAEDPENKFMPSPGKIEFLHLPGGRGVRLDTHIYSGYTISPYYDSMLAKLIVHGKDRNDAIKIMKRALEEFHISPIKTTIGLHSQILDNRMFLDGEVSTHFLEKIMKDESETRK